MTDGLRIRVNNTNRIDRMIGNSANTYEKKWFIQECKYFCSDCPSI